MASWSLVWSCRSPSDREDRRCSEGEDRLCSRPRGHRSRLSRQQLEFGDLHGTYTGPTRDLHGTYTGPGDWCRGDVKTGVAFFFCVTAFWWFSLYVLVLRWLNIVSHVTFFCGLWYALVLLVDLVDSLPWLIAVLKISAWTSDGVISPALPTSCHPKPSALCSADLAEETMTAPTTSLFGPWTCLKSVKSAAGKGVTRSIRWLFSP